MKFASRTVRGALFLACAVLGGLPLSGGCSYIFVTPPRSDYYGGPVAGDCTSNVAAPVIDTLLTTTNLFSTLYVAGENNVTNKGQAVGVGLLATGFWLSSAIYGYYNTSKCSDLRNGEDQGPYRRPVRVRRTVLTAPPQPTPMQPPPQQQPPGTTPQAPLPPAPPPYPSDGAGGAAGAAGVGGVGGPVAPAPPAPVAPALPRARQQMDQDDPG